MQFVVNENIKNSFIIDLNKKNNTNITNDKTKEENPLIKYFFIDKNDNNVLLTGSAGTGKSTIIKDFVKRMVKEYDVKIDEYALTSSTGVSALNIGGETIHHFLGLKINILEKDKDFILKELNKYSTKLTNNEIQEYEKWKGEDFKLENSKIKNLEFKKFQLKNLKFLIIDEISIIYSGTLDLIDSLLKEFKKNDKPFGGIRMIFVGDFLQLPPITNSLKINTDQKFAFENPKWHTEWNIKTIYLTKNYRQKDLTFLENLNKIRIKTKNSKIDRELANYLYSFVNIDEKKQERTKNNIILVSKNSTEDKYNLKKLEEIEGTLYKISQIKKFGNKEDLESLNSMTNAPKILNIKEGAKVMILINDQKDKKYYNGSTGIVLKISFNGNLIDSIKVRLDETGESIWFNRHIWKYEQKDYINKKINTLASIAQFPLMVSYAITIHKAQGLTINDLTIDCNGIFEDGQFYVAISRLINTDNLVIQNYDIRKIHSNPTALKFYENINNYYEKYIKEEQGMNQLNFEERILDIYG